MSILLGTHPLLSILSSHLHFVIKDRWYFWRIKSEKVCKIDKVIYAQVNGSERGTFADNV